MTQIERKVTLLAHTQLSKDFDEHLADYPLHFHDPNEVAIPNNVSDGQKVALSAIRTCYSPGKPSSILTDEGARYFKRKATDGGKGTDADRLIRMIQSSGHTSTLEHLSYTFAVEGISRALLAQLTRHRVGFSFSVQSQRYVKFGSENRSGGFDYIVPDTVSDDKAVRLSEEGEKLHVMTAIGLFYDAVANAQRSYDLLRKAGVPAEDARAVLPNATACNLVLTVNLRALLDFYAKRKAGRGAQSEIAGLADDLRKAVEAVEPWCHQLFEAV